MKYLLLYWALGVASVSWAKKNKPTNTSKDPQTAEPFDETAFVDIDMKQVRTKRRIAPVFPIAAQKQKLSGTCDVALFVNEKGVPVKASSVCSQALFIDTATSTALKWRFHPHKVDEETVPFTFTLKLKFEIK